MRCKHASLMDQLERYFDTYLPIAKGLSASTVVSYKAAFRLFFEFMFTVKGIPPEKVGFSEIDVEVITSFLDWLEAERGCSISTRNQRLSALAAFSDYAQNRDFHSAAAFRRSVLQVPRKKTIQKCRNTFTREEVKLLLKLPDSKTPIGLRDKTLLCFLYASGARAQEVCNLTVGDIQFYSDRAGINLHGKGRKIRRIGIPCEAASMLKKYISYRRISNHSEAHVFSSQTHEQMTVSCVEEIFAKYILKAKQAYPERFKYHYTPHSMRHTTATHMLEAGVPLIVVKNFLGHVSIQTTQIYTEVTQDSMSRQLKSWNDKWFLNDDSGCIDSGSRSCIPEFLR